MGDTHESECACIPTNARRNVFSKSLLPHEQAISYVHKLSDTSTPQSPRVPNLFVASKRPVSWRIHLHQPASRGRFRRFPSACVCSPRSTASHPRRRSSKACDTCAPLAWFLTNQSGPCAEGWNSEHFRPPSAISKYWPASGVFGKVQRPVARHSAIASAEKDRRDSVAYRVW